MAQSLTNAKIADTYKTLLKAGSNNPVALAAGSGSSERLVFGEDDAADVRTALYVTQDRLGIGPAAPLATLMIERAARTTVFDAANSDSYADIIVRNPTDTIGAATGIKFTVDNATGTTEGVGIAGVKTNGTAQMMDLVFITDPTGASPVERMRIQSDGYVGIGGVDSVSDPLAKLHIVGADNTASGLLIQQAGVDATNDYPVIRLMRSKGSHASQATVVNGDKLGSIQWLGYIGSNGDSYTNYETACSITAFADNVVTNTDEDMPTSLRFYTTGNLTATNSERMRITSTGYVGVNFAVPEAKLHVRDHMMISRDSTTPATQYFRFETNVSGHLLRGISQEDNNKNFYFDNIWEAGGTPSGDSYFAWRNGDFSSPVTAMKLTEDGNLGIGITPTAALHCLTPLGASAADNWVAKFVHTSTTDGNCLGVNIDFSAADPDDETQSFLYCTDSAAARYVIYSSGDSWSVDGGAVNSDERLKENIVDATSKLDDINKLKVRNFNFRQTDKDTGQKIHGVGAAARKRLGFIAQEVEAVFPSLVKESELISARETVEAKDAVLDSDGNILEEAIEGVTKRDQLIRKNLKVDALVPMLVKAIQELSAKVTALENA